MQQDAILATPEITERALKKKNITEGREWI